MENLEKDAEKDHKIEVKDEKVFLKPIESDDEPMFGYDESENDEIDEDEHQNEINI